VQRKRELPVRVVQAAQSFAQRRVTAAVLSSDALPAIPGVVRVLTQIPILRDLPPRLVAFGIGRPRVESPALATPTPNSRAVL
jgi:hypothetical protein